MKCSIVRIFYFQHFICLSIQTNIRLLLLKSTIIAFIKNVAICRKVFPDPVFLMND